MNLKFLDDIHQTFIDMRPSIYVLGYLAGIQAVSFAAYLAYKYIQDNQSKDKSKDEQKEEQEKVPSTPDNDNLPELQMEPIDQILDNESKNVNTDKVDSNTEKELFSLLTTKRDELENLITQLNMIQTNIMTIRDKLEELNKSNEK
jgi:heme/copper-type cytochrome/quinol oxidase subunit 1